MEKVSDITGKVATIGAHKVRIFYDDAHLHNDVPPAPPPWAG